MNYIEVDQESHMLVAELEIGQQLSLMDRRDGVDRPDLNDDEILHQNVQAKAQINPDAAIDDWNG